MSTGAEALEKVRLAAEALERAGASIVITPVEMRRQVIAERLWEREGVRRSWRLPGLSDEQCDALIERSNVGLWRRFARNSWCLAVWHRSWAMREIEKILRNQREEL